MAEPTHALDAEAASFAAMKTHSERRLGLLRRQLMDSVKAVRMLQREIADEELVQMLAAE